MTDEQIEAIRAKNEDDKAVQAAVVQPESQIVRMAETIDALLAEVDRTRRTIATVADALGGCATNIVIAQASTVYEGRERLRAEVTRLSTWQPGRWFSVFRDGRLMMETSDGEEARQCAESLGVPLYRQWVTNTSELRKVAE